jgi:hypothetical protein
MKRQRSGILLYNLASGMYIFALRTETHIHQENNCYQMKKLIIYFTPFLVILSIFLFSCKKESNCTTPIDNNICVSDSFPCEILPSQSGFGWNYSYDSLLYTVPAFLPNSNNEFYVVKEFSWLPHVYDLIKYNINTKVTTLIAHDVPNEGSLAVNNEWIVFTNYWTHKIFKVPTSGGSPILISRNNDWNYNPIFLANQQTLLVDASNNVKLSYIVNLSGNIEDTVPFNIHYFACSKNNDFVGINGRIDSVGRFYYSIWNYSNMSKVKRMLYEKESLLPEGVNSIYWHPNGKKLYYTSINGGLASIDIELSERKQLRTNCSYSYKSVNVSSDGTKLICNVGITKPLGGQDVRIKSIITIMNIDGSCEKRVL